MFDAVRNNKKVVQVFLALITLPFAFFGVESYMRSGGAGDDVAKVGDIKITQQQFQQALREQQERMRGQLGGQFDAKLFDTPEARKAILDDLVDQRLLLQEASKKHIFASDEAVRRMIAGIDAFKVDGKFSSERYTQMLAAQGMNPQGFEAQLRQDITLQQLASSVAQSGIVSKTASERLIALQSEKRDIQEFRFALDSYLDKAKPSEEAVRKFYDENGKQFATPEQAKVEYLVLSAETISAQLAVSDAEIKSWYDSHKDKFAQGEERRASHILISAEKIGKEKAKAKAEELLKEIRKTPAAFADLAKQNSDDPGSAAKGGDLGFFGHGMMVKPFEEAAFALKDGEVSNVVESDFGFHIIKLTGIHAAKEKPLAEVRAQIEAELKAASATRKFAEAAEAFSNLVYEQSDSLKPAAEKFKLTVKQSDWLSRQPNPAAGPLGNEKVLSALFAEDSVKNKRNTEAIEIAPNTLLAARVLEYKPAAQVPFEQVKANIEAMLKRKEAQALAVKDGEARLEALKKGEDKLAWGSVKSVSRLDARQLPPPAAQPIFRADTAKLPAYVGVELPASGYALYKLVKVGPGEQIDETRRQALQRQLAQIATQEEVQTYLAALRTRYKVDINKQALEAKER